MPFEYREHTGEAWIVGTGKTLEEAFAEGAKGLFNLMVDISKVKPRQPVEVEVRADDIEKLFVEWLNALIVHKDSQGLVFSSFEVEPIRKINEVYELEAKAWGEPFNSAKHESKVDVKAATYAELKCERTPEGYRVGCVVDI